MQDEQITRMYEQLGISKDVYRFGTQIEEKLRDRVEAIDRTAEYNQLKVIHAMQENRVSEGCFHYTSGYGVGGGTLLVLYLTAVAGLEQYQAGGINLLYFIACAPAALYAHVKNGLVEGRAVRWCVAAGVLTSVAAAFLAARMDTDWLRRLFGVFLLYVGAKELFSRREKTEK